MSELQTGHITLAEKNNCSSHKDDSSTAAKLQVHEAAYCVGATSWIPGLNLSWKPLLLTFPPMEKMQIIMPSFTFGNA